MEKENAIIEIRVLEEVKCQYDDYYKDTVWHADIIASADWIENYDYDKDELMVDKDGCIRPECRNDGWTNDSFFRENENFIKLKIFVWIL